ncbi:hypothetical protein ACFQL1_14745 [Halomicroarcula sp. GCM10025709]|uniref:DUF7519 family protein n=1 Tax=Haloarcula TaxID=2237 RepID=UPI0024C222EC|nr:hypothetical protein [Halomicroarcula sp. YJ-61-S]
MRRPRLVGVASLVAALVATAVLAATAGGRVALLGALVLAAGVLDTRRRLVTLGTVLQCAGVVLAGLTAAGAIVLVLAVAAALLAWDFGQYAVDLAESMADDAITHNAELVRVAGGTLLAALTVGALSLAGLALTVPTVGPVTTGLLLIGSVLAVAGLSD